MSHIAFRTDATSLIGTGHFMRCLTLASALKGRGSHVRFVSRNLPEHLHNMLVEKDIEFISLVDDITLPPDGDLAHSNWLGASQAQDAQATIQALSDQLWDWLVVDHYALDVRWERVLRGTAKQTMVIDDIADRQHDCDVLLDQNFYADMQTRYVNKVPEQCLLLLGPRYALLRDEFRVMREQLKPRSGVVKNILVFFGGVDTDNYTGFTLEALAEIERKELKVDVVIGAQHPCREQILKTCVRYGFVCHVQTAHMAELMAKADLAIGAGGSAIWERCAMGLPSLVMEIAENQHKSANDLDGAGVIISLGEARLVVKNTLVQAIEKLVVDEELRVSLSNASLQLLPIFKCNELTDIIVGKHV